MNAAKLDSGRLVQGLILFGFNIYLIKMLVSGDVFKLLSPLAANLLWATAAVMIVMMGYCLKTMINKEAAHAHDHGHDHGHDHHNHACGHDHAHEHHNHSCGHDHGHDHANCDHDHDHDHNPKPRLSWAIIAVPMVLGLVVPTQSLDSSMMASGLQIAPTQVELINELPAEDTTAAKTNTTTTTTTSNTPATAPQQTAATAQPQKQEEATPLGSVSASSYKTDFTKVPRSRGPMPQKPQPGKELKMNDMAAGIAVAPEFFYEQRFNFVGMVYRPEGYPENRFVLLRYMIAHCSADSTAIGLVVETNDASKYQNDQWVQVNATVALRNAPDFDQLAPTAWFKGYPYKPMLIGHDVQTVEAPKYPYLYSTFAI